MDTENPNGHPTPAAAPPSGGPSQVPSSSRAPRTQSEALEGCAALAGSHADVAADHGADIAWDPALEILVREIIGRVADKWTMLVLEALEEARGEPMRFTELSKAIGGISQKMLTKTLRGMEADGLVSRTVYPVVPPRVEYALTERGRSLGAAFCGVWVWAARHQEGIAASRAAFAQRATNDDE